jgi:hypothetical protein
MPEAPDDLDRALAVEEGEDLTRVWIGTHEEYDRLIQGN